VSPVRYELGVHIPEDDILHSHHCENVISYGVIFIFFSHIVYKISEKKRFQNLDFEEERIGIFSAKCSFDQTARVGYI
jgi:hypothetical protein